MEVLSIILLQENMGEVQTGKDTIWFVKLVQVVELSIFVTKFPAGFCIPIEL